MVVETDVLVVLLVVVEEVLVEVVVLVPVKLAVTTFERTLAWVPTSAETAVASVRVNPGAGSRTAKSQTHPPPAPVQSAGGFTHAVAAGQSVAGVHAGLVARHASVGLGTHVNTR